MMYLFENLSVNIVKCLAVNIFYPATFIKRVAFCTVLGIWNGSCDNSIFLINL